MEIQRPGKDTDSHSNSEAVPPTIQLEDTFQNNLTGSDYFSPDEEEDLSHLPSISPRACLPEPSSLSDILDVVSAVKLSEMVTINTQYDPDLERNNTLGRNGTEPEAVWAITQAERLKASKAQTFTELESFRKKVSWSLLRFQMFLPTLF